MKRSVRSWYNHSLSQGNGDSTSRGMGMLSILSSLKATTSFGFSCSHWVWTEGRRRAEAFGLESQIANLSTLTAGICTAASIMLSVGEVSFLTESRVHPPSTGWWKLRFSFGKSRCTKQQRPVPRMAHKSELKLHFQGHEIFSSWQQHTFQDGSLLDLPLLREATS